MSSFLNKYGQFLRNNKKYWLMPVLLVVVLLLLVTVLNPGSSMTPFRYTPF
ncbi:DUF5989 family protein [Paramagnetospirillum marisnigri]|uniref:DUF5989 family protein n=1 Tax=Paramagnetospirillum marisnigri TaxID=1285242 RepID=UPI00389916AF